MNQDKVRRQQTAGDTGKYGKKTSGRRKRSASGKMGKKQQGTEPQNDELLEAASHVPICQVQQAIHVPLYRCPDGRLILFRHPEVEVFGCRWKHPRGETGPAGLFSAGNAVHLAVEYGGMTLEDALKAIMWAVSETGAEPRVEFRRRCAMLELEAEYPETGALALPQAAANSSEAAIAQLERCGISRLHSESLAAKGSVYVSDPEGEIIFTGCGPGDTQGGVICTLLGNEWPCFELLPESHPFSCFVVPGTSRELQVYADPLELLVSLQLAETGDGTVQTPFRLALFMNSIQAVLAYVFTHGGIREVKLCLPMEESAAELVQALRSELRPYVRVRSQKPPAGFPCWLDAVMPHWTAHGTGNRSG